MTQSPAYYKKGFDTSVVSAYDLFVNLATFYQMKKYRAEAVKMLNLKKGESVIDFACGTGEFTLLLAEEVGETGKVMGIDLSHKMLNIAIKKSKNYSQISYLRQNFEKTVNGHFDAAVIGLAVHEVPPQVRLNLYKSAYSSLKSKGKLLIMDYAPYSTGIAGLPYRIYLKTVESPYGFEYASEEHEKILKELGFNRLEKRNFLRIFDICIYNKV